jgi:predicted 2-oxoglutarate/Fe(II)-dependent dioxygenase YbiX
MIALRIELSRKPYEGGNFYFKKGETIHVAKDLHFGDAVLFKVVSNKYYHRVDPVTQGERRSIIIFFTRKASADENY